MFVFIMGQAPQIRMFSPRFPTVESTLTKRSHCRSEQMNSRSFYSLNKESDFFISFFRLEYSGIVQLSTNVHLRR